MRTTTWLIDWASCWTSPGVAPEGGAVELPEDIPLPASSARRTESPADSRRYRMALPLFHWAGIGANHSAARAYVKKSTALGQRHTPWIAAAVTVGGAYAQLTATMLLLDNSPSSYEGRWSL